MKTPKTGLIHYLERKHKDLLPIPGFNGYYVDQFNRIISLSTPEGRFVRPWLQKCGSGTRIKCVNLFDDEGRRKAVSMRKILSIAYGTKFVQDGDFAACEPDLDYVIKKEGRRIYEHMEKTKSERMAKEEKERLERRRKLQKESDEMIKEIHG